jgi:hypothetical protein
LILRRVLPGPLDALTGCVLLAFGVRLAFEQR